MNNLDKILTDICAYLNNYFWRQKITGKFKIEGGAINVPALKNGQYFRIIGSIFNEGVHKYPATGLQDEEFEGAIWSMAVPTAVIDLASEIKEWIALYGGVDSQAMSPFASESFGNYSYSKGTVTSAGADGNSNSWQTVFGARLAPYRRLRGIP